MNRTEIAELVFQRISKDKTHLKKMYKESHDKVGYFYIDDLLPNALAKRIFDVFPNPEAMKLKKSLREYKYIAAQMDLYDPILEAVIYAFQDERIIKLIRNICEIKCLYPDEHLYAGGISLMGKGQFLNPHLDNSHEKDCKRWRVLNLLYYVTPGWEHNFGGNLEIWPNGLKSQQITIDSLFNRLVVMATHGNSWHSVSPIVEEKDRACVSNYYFSDAPLKENDCFHVTSFRGRPEQRTRDIVLQADMLIRQSVRKLFPKGVVKTAHLYKK